MFGCPSRHRRQIIICFAELAERVEYVCPQAGPPQSTDVGFTSVAATATVPFMQLLVYNNDNNSNRRQLIIMIITIMITTIMIILIVVIVIGIVCVSVHRHHRHHRRRRHHRHHRHRHRVHRASLRSVLVPLTALDVSLTSPLSLLPFSA